MLLGAGRDRAGDPVNHFVGVKLTHQVGDRVFQGDPLFAVLYHQEASLSEVISLLESAVEIGPAPPPKQSLILETIP
jgi:thymidine phosphorylase